jgi:hypothetical protein
VALVLARRLRDLGFPEPALNWLGPVSLADTDERRLLAASVELALGDARQTLTLVSGLDGAEADLLRAEAQVRLGALAAAQSAMVAIGKPEEAARLAAWEADWSGLLATGDETWAAAAGLAAAPKVVEGGPLARGSAALESSAATREAISGLLSAIGGPGP